MTLSFLRGAPIEKYREFLGPGWRVRGYTAAREDIEFTFAHNLICTVDGQQCMFDPVNWILDNGHAALQLDEIVPLGKQ